MNALYLHFLGNVLDKNIIHIFYFVGIPLLTSHISGLAVLQIFRVL